MTFYFNDLNVSQNLLRCKKSIPNDLRVWEIWVKENLIWEIECLLSSLELYKIMFEWFQSVRHLRWKWSYLTDLNALMTHIPRICAMWIINLSASKHMTLHKDAFHTYEVITPRNVDLGDNNVVQAIGMGSIVVEAILEGKNQPNLYRRCTSRIQIVCQFALGEQTCVKRFKNPIQPKQMYCQIFQWYIHCNSTTWTQLVRNQFCEGAWSKSG